MRFSLAIAFALAGAAPCAADDAPPPGLAPASRPLAEVMELVRTSFGSATVPQKSSIEEAKVVEGGLSGTYYSVHLAKDFRTIETLGPLRVERGRYRGQDWFQNENGLTTAMQGVHKRDEVSTLALRGQLKEDPDAVRIAGEVASPAPAFVLDVKPKGGRHEWVFVDKLSGHVVRAEAIAEGIRIVTTYDDFRTVNGETFAWHSHSSDGRPNNDLDFSIIRYRVNVAVSDADVALPPDRRRVVLFPDGVTSVKLPAKIVDDTVTVRLVINGRGLDFILDSGAADIVLNNGIADALKLPSIGKQTGATAGTYQYSHTIIPSASIGALRLNDLVVTTLPFSERTDFSTRAEGLLGYDFIADTVLKIDYQHGTVEAIDPQSFTAPSGQHFELRTALDDQVPLVTARVGGSTGDHFIIDTGAFATAIFSDFAAQHPADVADQGLGKEVSRYFPIILSGAVGGELALRPVQVKDFVVGTVHLDNWLMFVPKSAPAFEGEDYDGLIGYDFLRYFTVYFDYLHSRVLLYPNDLYKRESTPYKA